MTATPALDPWVFECRGKARPGDSAGMAGLHVWKRRGDGGADCLKCGTPLTPPQAARCWGEA